MITPKQQQPHLHYLGHHYYKLSLSDLCSGVEYSILKETKHSPYVTNTTTS